MIFKEAVNEAMRWLAQDERVLFIGQQVAYSGHVMYDTLEGVPMGQRFEFPVAEDFQMGFCIGLALQGYLPIAIYPRMDFLILAMNQLVNHLDKLAEMSQGEFKPRVIIRTMRGSIKPLNPGPQHSQDHTEAFMRMLKHVQVFTISKADLVRPTYKMALESGSPTLVIEAPDEPYLTGKPA